MPTPGRLLRAVTAAVALGLATGALIALPGAPGQAATAETSMPLVPTIDTLTPGALSWKAGPKSVVTVTGTVTNVDDETWHDVKVYPWFSSTPITTRQELTQAADSPATEPVGVRITADADPIGDIAPGQSVRYTITVRRSELAAEGLSGPGVYWFGVHALGDSAEHPFDLYADGRARTFLPLLPQQTRKSRSVRVGLLLPLRRHVVYTAAGRVANPTAWTSDLTHGRLANALSLGSTPAQVTWLVDPAVLDAVRRLAAGNPPLDLSDAATPAAASSTPSASTAATPNAAASASPNATGSTTETADTADAAARAAAKSWLEAFLQSTRTHQVLALPYGDPDVPAMAEHDPTLYAQARTEGESVLKALGITATQANAPATGYLSAASLGMLDDAPLTIVGSSSLDGWVRPEITMAGHAMAVTSSAAGEGGPQPGDPYAPVAVRQRILAEAAVRSGSRNPLLVTLPDDWEDASAPGDLLAPFAKSWVTLEPFTIAATGNRQSIDTSRLRYPDSDAAEQVTPDTFSAADDLIDTGRTLDTILPQHTGVANAVLDQALTSLSYAARQTDDAPVMAGLDALNADLGQIKLEPPTAVTLSSGTGRFSVTVTNNLAETVQVSLHATSDAGIDIRGPSSVRIAPGDTASVLMSADVRTPGVHQIGLQLTDAAGTMLGSSATFPLRSAQVSKVIWIFIGAGVGILFLAIVIRLGRRIASRKTSRTEA